MRRRNRLRHLGLLRPHSTTRSSPSRRVICSRSRYSSSGMAYLREIPVHSLNSPHAETLRICAGQNLPQPLDGGLVKHQLLVDPQQPLLAHQNLQQRAARAGSTPDFASTSAIAGTASPAVFEGAFDGARAPALRPPAAPRCGCAGEPVSPSTDDLRGAGQQRVQQERRNARHLAGAQVLLGDSGRPADFRDGTRAPCDRALARAPAADTRSTYHGPGIGRPPSADALAAAAAMFAFASSRCAPPVPRCPRRNRASRTSRAMRPAASPAHHVQASRSASLRWSIADARQVEHHAAADGDHRRKHADDEAVARQQQRRAACSTSRAYADSPGRSTAAPPSSRTSAPISAVPA